MSPATLQISALSAASPDMPDLAFAELVEDIKRRGQLVPIWRCGDEIIDGRKRFRACELLGIEPVVLDMSPDQHAEALSYSLNILRTHYTQSQLAMFAARRATATSRDGASRRKCALSISGGMTPQIKTAAEAGQEVGVHKLTVKEAKRLLREAEPEVVSAVEAGKLTLHAAQQIVKKPRAEQIAAMSTREASKRRERQPPPRALGKINGFHRSPRRALAGRMDRALDQLENALGALDDFVQESDASQHADRGAWATRLTLAKGELTKIIAHTTRGRSTA